MTPTLYTIGYEKRSLEEYVDLLIDHGIDVVLDVRETAWSYKPGFSKGPLASALAASKIHYIHAKFAGNPKRFRRQAKSHAECLRLFRDYVRSDPTIVAQLEATVAELHGRGLRVAVTCFERHPGDCHRNIVAEAWAALGNRGVAHIAPHGCNRLVTA